MLGRPHPAWRLASFLGGLLLVATAVVSPLEHHGNTLLWVNFLGFLVLTMAAAPLLVLGAPLTLAFRVATPQGRRRLRCFHRSRTVRIVSNPFSTWFSFAVVTYIWQFSGLTDTAATNDVVRDLQQGSLLGVSYLFWMVPLCADPVAWRMAWPLRALYVFVEMTHKGLFGGMFLSMNHSFHDGFAERLPAWSGMTPIMDQRIGIGILWVGGNLAFVIALGFLIAGWLSYERRHAHRTDWRLALKRDAERRRLQAMEQVFRRTPS